MQKTTEKGHYMTTRISKLATIILLAGLMLLVTSQSWAQSEGSADGVRAASKAFYAALAVLDDGTAMAKVWAQKPYVTFVGPRSKSIIVGWEAQKQYWRENNQAFDERNASLAEQRIHVNGNLAWEMGVETGNVKRKNGTASKVDNLVTNVYERIDGRWLMVSHHAQPKPQ
jgi:ketosteroid isomerase-like protein